MFSADVTYDDFDGKRITEKLYFHLTKMDLMDMEVEYEGGYKKYLEDMIRMENKQEIYEHFKKLVIKSYGVKLPDGRFYKDEIETKVFKSSEAFSEFTYMLSQDENLQVQFVNGIFPKLDEGKKAELIKEQTSVIDGSAKITEIPKKEYSKEDIDRIVKAELERIRSEGAANVTDNGTNT